MGWSWCVVKILLLESSKRFILPTNQNAFTTCRNWIWLKIRVTKSSRLYFIRAWLKIAMTLDLPPLDWKWATTTDLRYGDTVRTFCQRCLSVRSLIKTFWRIEQWEIYLLCSFLILFFLWCKAVRFIFSASSSNVWQVLLNTYTKAKLNFFSL